MRNSRNSTRPLWAKKLPTRLWKALHTCQGKRPTLAQLKADVQYQTELATLAGRPNYIACWDCREALAIVNRK